MYFTIAIWCSIWQLSCFTTLVRVVKRAPVVIVMSWLVRWHGCQEEEAPEDDMDEDLVAKAEKEFFEIIEHERKIEERKKAAKGGEDGPTVSAGKCPFTPAWRFCQDQIG